MHRLANAQLQLVLKEARELEFWDNVSVNLLSNAIWVVLAYFTVQVVKRLFARANAPTDEGSTSSHAKSQVPIAPRDALGTKPSEGVVSVFRRIVRATFSLAGLLITLLLICSTISEGDSPLHQAASWSSVVGVWLFWSWAMRDPRLAGKVYRGSAPIWLRAALAAVTIGFWLAILAGLVWVVYAK